jgi:hypothetical protein
MFRILRSELYAGHFRRLARPEQRRCIHAEEQLKTAISGRMLGYPFLREKRLNGKRILFLVYETHQVIFLVLITDKKVQQDDIDAVRENLELYQKHIEAWAKRL